MVTNINQLDLNKLYTYADYLLWQFSERIELLRGKIFKMSPAPSTLHQSIFGRLFVTLYPFLQGKNVVSSLLPLMYVCLRRGRLMS